MNLQLHNKLLVVAKGLRRAELKARAVSTSGATVLRPVQGQDGVIVTALLQEVVDPVPTPGCRLTQP